MSYSKKKIICHNYQVGECELNYACVYSHAIAPKIKGECEYGKVCSMRHVERDCPSFLKSFECPKGLICDYIHNWSLKYNEENNLEFQKNLSEINNDLKLLEEYQKQIIARASLDILFIMDCTGSMGPWIKTCKNELNTIFTTIKSNFPKSTIRGAFVGK